MAIPPGSDIIEDDISTELSVGKEEMLYALISTLEAVEDRSILKEEYYIKLHTPGFCHESGCQREPNLHEFECLKSEVRSTFEAIENGRLTEEEYCFVLITPYFYYRSGNYQKRENLECTLNALVATYDAESGDELLQEHIVSAFEEWIASFEVVIVLDRCQGFFNIMLGIITYLQKIVHLLESKKRGSAAGIKPQFNNYMVILLVGLFAVPIPSVQAAHQETPLTLRAGSNGVIPFNCSVRDLPDVSNVYYTVRFEAKDRPFCVNGAFDLEGFIYPDQSERFSSKLNVDINILAVNINIVPVSAEDEGTYELHTLYNFGSKDVESHFMKQVVKVHVPPSPAKCFFMPSAKYGRLVVRCKCRPGSGNSTLSCFQNGAKIPFMGLRKVVTYRTFWVMNETSPLVCCSHEYGEEVTAASCGQQFRFPHHEAKTTMPPRTKGKEGSGVEDYSKPTNVILPKASEEPGMKGSGYAMRSSLLFSSLLPLLKFLI